MLEIVFFYVLCFTRPRYQVSVYRTIGPLVHNLTRWSLEIFNLCTVLKNHEPVHVKHRKCIFVPQGKYSRMRTINLNLIMQKGSRVVQMIITRKSFHIIYICKR